MNSGNIDVVLFGGGKRSKHYLYPLLIELSSFYKITIHCYSSRASTISDCLSTSAKLLIVSTGSRNRILVARRLLFNSSVIAIDGPPLSIYEVLTYVFLSLFKNISLYHIEDQIYKTDIDIDSNPFALHSRPLVINTGVEDLNHLIFRLINYICRKYGNITGFLILFALPICYPRANVLKLYTPLFTCVSTLVKVPVPISALCQPSDSFLSNLFQTDSHGSKMNRVSLSLESLIQLDNSSIILPNFYQSIISRILLTYISISIRFFSLFGF